MKSKGIVALCLFALPCILLSGCVNLQFGGKTHNCNGLADMAAANARVAQLESRINALEHYASITPPAQSSVSVASYQIEQGGVQVRKVETIPSVAVTR